MTETEIKLAVDNAAVMRRKLRSLGWRASGRRRAEKNRVYDRSDRSLLSAGCLLRVREVGRRCWLTVKHPVQPGGVHKVREEFEIETRNADEVTGLLDALGFQVIWRYDKMRTEFRKRGQKGKILLDQTPIGDFLELEGEPGWIDQTAAQLGSTKGHYVTGSYYALFVEYAGQHRGVGHDMVFGGRGLAARP